MMINSVPKFPPPTPWIVNESSFRAVHVSSLQEIVLAGMEGVGGGAHWIIGSSVWG